MLIIISWPFNERAYTRLGIDVLEKNNIKFKILNLFELLYPKNKHYSFERVYHKNEITIRSLSEFRRYIKEDKIILNYLNIKIKTLKFFILFTLLKIDYISISNMPLPSKKNYKLIILNFLLRPAKYGAIVEKKLEYPFGKKTDFIYIHSIDFDTMIRHERGSEDRIVKENYIVFLDQNLPFHLDFKRNNTKSYVTENRYYNALNRYFDDIESKLKIKVIVASHPNSNDANYYNKLAIKNKTLNLIKYADSVLLHNSTAISFAIMYEKPSLIVVTDEIINSEMYGSCKMLSDEIGVPIVNIDNCKMIQFVKHNHLFDKYRQRYISQSFDKKLLSMEIILKKIKDKKEK